MANVAHLVKEKDYIMENYPSYSIYECRICGKRSILKDDVEGCEGCRDNLKRQLNTLRDEKRVLEEELKEAWLKNKPIGLDKGILLLALHKHCQMIENQLEKLTASFMATASYESYGGTSITPEEYHKSKHLYTRDIITPEYCKWHGHELVNGKCVGNLRFKPKKLKSERHELKVIMRLSNAYRDNKQEICDHVAENHTKDIASNKRLVSKVRERLFGNKADNDFHRGFAGSGY